MTEEEESELRMQCRFLLFSYMRPSRCSFFSFLIHFCLHLQFQVKMCFFVILNQEFQFSYVKSTDLLQGRKYISGVICGFKISCVYLATLDIHNHITQK